MTQALLVLAAIAGGVAPIPAAFVETWYSGRLYPVLQHAVTPVSNAVPFALFDFFVLGAAAGTMWMLLRGVKAARRSKQVEPALAACRDVCVIAASGYLIFLFAWGFNYRRLPISDRLVVNEEPPGSDAVVRLGLEAVAHMNRLREEAHRVGWTRDEWRDGRLQSAFVATQRALSDAPHAQPGRLKWSLFGFYFRWAGVDGMVDPFALEVLANPDLLPWERPFVAAHEWAHLAGYAHETEANFVGWLTCVRGDAAAQYSGWQFLYWQIASEIAAPDRATIEDALEPGPRRDVEAIIDRLRRGQLPLLRDASWHLYDQYLRANRVEEGIRSYGEVVNLILRARFEDGWTPVRAPARPSP